MPAVSSDKRKVTNEVPKTKSKKRGLWRRADKRREVAERVSINPAYEYPPDHVSDGRLLFLYRKLNKDLTNYFNEHKNELTQELSFYAPLSTLLESNTQFVPINHTLFAQTQRYSLDQSVCDGCGYNSPSEYHHYPLSDQSIRVFRSGKEIQYQNSSFSATTYSVTAICIGSYDTFLSFI